MPEQLQTEKFDLQTHHFDGRGRLKGHNPYRLHIERGTSLFERPVNSGNLFYENNEVAGRVEYTRDEDGRIIGKKFDPKAAHKAYQKPLSADEKVHYENESMREKIAKLEAELAAVKAEQDAKAPPAAAPKAAEAAKPQVTVAAEVKPAAQKAPPSLPEI